MVETIGEEGDVDVPPWLNRQRDETADVYSDTKPGQRGGRGGTRFMHSHSYMTIDRRTSMMPGRGTSGFHQAGRHRVQQAQDAVRRSANCTTDELRPY